MQDMTTGSVSRHLLRSTGFMLVMMVFQTLYVLIDLYWVGRLGTSAVAAVGIAGNVTFLILGLSQMLGVGTTTLVAHAVGRKDHPEAARVFNQAQGLALIVSAVFLVTSMAARRWYADAMSADAETARLTVEFLTWFLPAMALQFPMVAMGSALRGTGNFKPSTVASIATVIINILLAPVLIFGWGTGRPMGVAGAAMASLLAILVGIAWLAAHFHTEAAYLRFTLVDWRPRVHLWKRMLAIGLPAGFEFAMSAAFMLIVYFLARRFGAGAQAGFGIGMRILQAAFMPVVAMAFSAAPVAGQNFGARLGQRVRATFRDAALMAAATMLLFVIACHAVPDEMIRVFSTDPGVIAVGAEYLRITSWSFVAGAVVFVGSSMFQAMGNTVPSLIVSTVRILLVAIPAFVLAGLPDFSLRWIWYLSVGATLVQFAVSMLLLRREFDRRLAFAAPVT